MPNPKTVMLYLMDGTPTGRMKCSLSNWIGVVYLIPRADLGKCKDRPELNQTGVYLLFGTNEKTGEELAYVGQARERKNGNGVLGRIAEHVGEEKLDYFTHAVVIITSNDSFGPTEISYLENSFYQQARKAARVQVKNGNDPSPGKVTEEKQAELEEFINYAKIAIGSLGYHLFDEVTTSARSVPETENESLLFLNSSSASGKGRQTSEGFVVLEGAQLREDFTASCPDTIKRLREKYRDRIEEGELTKDTLFSSPSAAAGFLMGSSANGRFHWRDAQNVSLAELEARELEPVEDPED